MANVAQEDDESDDEDEEGGYFRALGVKSDVNDVDLKKAFRKKMIQWHPDKVKVGFFLFLGDSPKEKATNSENKKCLLRILLKNKRPRP